MARPGRKPSLTPEEVVGTAVAMADTEGLEGVSMPRLAARLGKATMSLYRYVSSKEELVALMLDRAIGAPDVAPYRDLDWRASLWRWATDARQVYLAHPWTLPLVTRRRTMGPNETAWLELAVASLAECDLTPAETIDTVLLVNGYVRGATEPLVDDSPATDDSVRPYQGVGAEEAYPSLASLGAIGPDPDERRRQGTAGFEFGLARILDGVEVYLSGRSRG
ncbi:TetR/AcrR family transcriptional regulator [Georgenia alba]|uniref:TetR/AcrR family transcriptional regulator n=1 Tax=Georgenia alba TaxID=2233858 RepID=A0ABW2Q4H1_9MICO